MSENRKEIATVEEALEDIRAGKFIVVIDDPDRENEGDLTDTAQDKSLPAQENVNFMACYAKGLILHAHEPEKLCEKLGLEQMVSVNPDDDSTAFAVSI